MKSSETPYELGFFQPPEWNTHSATWLAWPSHSELWKEELTTVQNSFVELSRHIVGARNSTSMVSNERQSVGLPVHSSERLRVLVPDSSQFESAKAALDDLEPEFFLIPFGDIWLRDTAPIFLVNDSGEVAVASFSFNGWGGKYILPGDSDVSMTIAEKTGLRIFRYPFVLEGGSIETDGERTCLTTRQCLLNPNRNRMSQNDIERGLRESLGMERILWLNEGLLNDHTDGHIDVLARFVKPGVVLCMRPFGDDDPNKDVLKEISADVKKMVDYRGRKLEVIEIPSPGLVVDPEDRILAASYVNFYISNQAVVVPIYGSHADDLALKEIEKIFPQRKVVGVESNSLLLGGGSFHCITQQQP